ncbi:MAG: hypothetical protein DI537_14525 [Stutzerimonas stutzeri]|nr:MAG: hypothetical protein DI537_14525 [Stutzerimonas stutzeri]
MSLEPTLGQVKTERAAQAAEIAVLKAKLEEETRIAKKRRLLAGLAQGLEELDRELAASKELRKQLKASAAQMKAVRDSMVEFEKVDDLSFEEILAHTELVRKTVRDAQADRGIFTMHLGDGIVGIPRVFVRHEGSWRPEPESIADMMAKCCGEKGGVNKAA